MKVGKNQPRMNDILGKPKAKNDTGEKSRVTTRIGAHNLDEVRFSTRKTKMTHQPDGKTDDISSSEFRVGNKTNPEDNSIMTTRIGPHHLDEVQFSTRKTKMTH